MPTRDRVEEWAEAYRVAWETADSDGVADLFTEDASYRSLIYEEPHRNRAGVIDYWKSVTSEQSEARVRMGEPFVDGSRVWVEFWTNMSLDGSPVTLAGCLLLEFDEDGLCSDLREYWTLTDGDHEPPEGWGK